MTTILPPPLDLEDIPETASRLSNEDRIAKLELERAELLGMLNGMLKGVRLVQWMLGGALVVGFAAASFLAQLVIDTASQAELNAAAIARHIPAHSHDGTRADVTDIQQRVSKLEARGERETP